MDAYTFQSVLWKWLNLHALGAESVRVNRNGTIMREKESW